MGGRRDPVDEWRELSARAAQATGYRPARDGSVRSSRGVGFGVVAAAIVVVLAGLALRPLSTATSSNPGPVVASATDAEFRLTLTTPKGTYTPQDAIGPVASLTYLGPDQTATIFHATKPAQFRIEEVGGTRVMGGGTTQPCISTVLLMGTPTDVAFGKGGSPTDDPSRGFDVAWYEDPILRLPKGTWRIVASLDVTLGGCSGERHALEVGNVIRVVSGVPAPTPSVPTLSAQQPTPLATPTPTYPVSSPPAATVVKTTRTLGDPNITLYPPGKAVPSISSDAAYRLCLNGVADCLPQPPTAIELALVTDTAYGTTSSAGVDTLTLKKTLVWAISWIGVSQCPTSGGGFGPQPTAPPVQPLCDRVAFVNARTGDFVFTVQYAHQ
jgi:hypothetical protein